MSERDQEHDGGRDAEVVGHIRAWWAQLIVLVTLASAAGVAHYRIGETEADVRSLTERHSRHAELPGHPDSIARIQRLEQRVDRQDIVMETMGANVETELRAVRESIVQLCTALRVNCRNR